MAWLVRFGALEAALLDNRQPQRQQQRQPQRRKQEGGEAIEAVAAATIFLRFASEGLGLGCVRLRMRGASAPEQQAHRLQLQRLRPEKKVLRRFEPGCSEAGDDHEGGHGGGMKGGGGGGGSVDDDDAAMFDFDAFAWEAVAAKAWCTRVELPSADLELSATHFSLVQALLPQLLDASAAEDDSTRAALAAEDDSSVLLVTVGEGALVLHDDSPAHSRQGGDRDSEDDDKVPMCYTLAFHGLRICQVFEQVRCCSCSSSCSILPCAKWSVPCTDPAR